MDDLRDKVAIVTGASKGIGAAIARRFAAAGAAVVVNYASSKDDADRVVGDILRDGGKAVAIQADVGRRADVRRLFAETKATFGTPSVLVNNAGVYRFRPAGGGDGSGVPPTVRHERAEHHSDDPGGGQSLRCGRR